LKDAAMQMNEIDNDEFRMEMRGFIEAHYPENLRYISRRPRWKEIEPWCMALVKKGWSAPAWPLHFGGMGLSPEKMLILQDEQERWGVARQFLGEHGTTQLGPMIIRYGSDEQRAKLLPKMRTYEQRWCQGYSEPNAGSDLASVATEAVPDGDEFVINGRKIWTSGAQDVHSIYMLVRTDRTVKKQLGISFLLVNLDSPGVSVRGIKNIAGSTEFCEVTFDNVRTPKANMVGEMNQGWTIAKGLLGFERVNSGSPRRAAFAFNRLEALARERGLFEDPDFRSRYLQLYLDMEDLKSVYSYFAGRLTRGEHLGEDLSVLKALSSETNQRITEFAMQVASDYGLLVDKNDNSKVDSVTPYLVARNVTIGAGTTEVQRNVIAKSLLGLPS